MMISTMISSSILKYIAVLVVLFMSVINVSSDNFCEEIPVINNGQLVLGDKNPPFKVNDTLSYTCNEDFKTETFPAVVTCVLKDNVVNWTQSACKPIIRSCHDPGFIENADRSGLVFTFPSSINYICHPGYKIVGISTKFCSKSGNWQPPAMPYCEEILCPDLSHPSDGEVSYPDRHFDSVAVYKCERYYKLVGDSQRVCNDNGSWSGNSPICEKITCKAPGKFPNGRIIGNKGDVYNATDILIFRCNDGVTHKSSKCLENGEWSYAPPVCPGTTDVETTTVAPTDFSISVTEEGNGTTVEFTTIPPTTLSQNVVEEEKSEAIFCEDPGKIKNGHRELRINSTVTYNCDEGYELRGRSTLLCLENGKWDLDKLPICVKPISVVIIIGIVIGVVLFVLLLFGVYILYRYNAKSIRGYGEKSKALTADATDIEEIAGLDRDKKQIPVTVL